MMTTTAVMKAESGGRDGFGGIGGCGSGGCGMNFGVCVNLAVMGLWIVGYGIAGLGWLDDWVLCLLGLNN